ncbi:MAG: SDR family oxidoreductase [Gammaproteobacteria bacterium]|nr:SDR family oxidoreductase [Gammaproteobacteria bacterium]
MNLVLLGAGYCATRFANCCLGFAHEITGTTRSSERTSEDGAWPVIEFDGKTVSERLQSILAEASHILVSIPPEREGDDADPALRALVPYLRHASLEWIGYLSTVGVYGDHAGAWVDESTECVPISSRSKRRLRAEGEWTALADHQGVPMTVFRLPGIYGPGRNAFVRLEEGQTRQLVKPDQVFNRIHVDDLSTAVVCAATQCMPGIYNITDDVPAPPEDVVRFAAALMGVDAPESVSWESDDVSPMAKSFYSENKRVSNALSKTIPGMHYRYADYVTGLRALWDSGQWRDDR